MIYRNKKTGKITFFTQGKIEDWFNLYIQDPLATWKRAKKYFKKPKISFKIHRVTKISGYPYATYNRIGKILDIWAHDVIWKDKWGSPRHERDPLIWICLFRCIALSVKFSIYYRDEFGEKQDGGMHYWEYLINWESYKDQKTLKCYHTWTGTSKLYTTRHWGNSEDGSDDTFTPIEYVIPEVAMSLNKDGIKALKEELS